MLNRDEKFTLGGRPRRAILLTDFSRNDLLHGTRQAEREDLCISFGLFVFRVEGKIQRCDGRTEDSDRNEEKQNHFEHFLAMNVLIGVNHLED